MRGKSERGRSGAVLYVWDLGGSGNGENVGAGAEEPREGHALGGDVARGGDLADGGMLGGEVFGAVHAVERRPGEKCNIVGAGECECAVEFGIAMSPGILILERDDFGAGGEGGGELGDGMIGGGDVEDFAFSLKFEEFAIGVMKRGFSIDTVVLLNGDGVDAEIFEGGFRGFANVRG